MRETHYRPRLPTDLTSRQREVLDLIARGKTNAEIGAALGITLAGAKAHVSHVLTKLEVASREEAADLWRSRDTGWRLSDLLARAAIPGMALKVGLGAAAAVTVIAAGALVYGMRSAKPDTEGEMVRGDSGQTGDFLEPTRPLPAFHATFWRGVTGSQDIHYEAWYQDDTTWRVEYTSWRALRTGQAAGKDVAVAAAGELSTYDAVEHVHSTDSLDRRSAENPSVWFAENPGIWLGWDNFSWLIPGIPGSVVRPTRELIDQHCTRIADDRIAGREAHHLVCGDPRNFQFWIDAREGWVLKWEWVPTGIPTAFGGGGGPPTTSFEILSLDVSPRFAADTFRFVPPPGSVTQEEASRDATRHSVLKIGDLAPAWTGTVLGGGSVGTSDIGGPAVYLFVAKWCEAACDVLEPFAAAATAWKGKVQFVLVVMTAKTPALDLPAGAQDYTVVLSGDRPPWSIGSIPYWVALDEKGVVRGLGVGNWFAGQEERLAAEVAGP